MSQCPFKPLIDLDTFAHGSPREYINELRAQHQILWEPDAFSTGGHWLLFQREDIDYVLRTTELFTNNWGQRIEDIPPDLAKSIQEGMSGMDPPQHRIYRGLAEYAFRPGLLKEREPVMRAMAKGIIDRIIDRGQCEFVNDVAIRLPMQVTFYLLGVRPDDELKLVNLTNAATLPNDPDFVEDRTASFEAWFALIEQGERLAADHRAHPRDDITMEILNAEIDGQRVSDYTFGRLFNLLIVAGIETTRNTLAWGMYDFAHHFDQYRMLQSNLSLIPNAVEEILRYRCPVSYLRRTATRDTEIAGRQIAKGDKVCCVIAAPNRDPAAFERPDVFDITRPPGHSQRNQRTFGGGPHYCLGVHQARMNLSLMLEEIVLRLDNPRIIGAPRHARDTFIDGFKELNIAFDKRPR
jgi:cholest-4-en-3-one 26-monooxygenase